MRWSGSSRRWNCCGSWHEGADEEPRGALPPPGQQERSDAGVVVRAWTGWALAALAVMVGYFTYGWPGVLLALSIVVFWLLLQFSRALRTMQRAGRAPVGQVPSAVMLNAKLRVGMTMLELLPLTGSLAQPVEGKEETFRWRDAGGSSVQLEFTNGRLKSWTLERGEAATTPGGDASSS